MTHFNESDKWSVNNKYQRLFWKVNFEGTDQYYLLDSQSRKCRMKYVRRPKSLKIQKKKKNHKGRQKYCNASLEL